MKFCKLKQRRGGVSSGEANTHNFLFSLAQSETLINYGYYSTCVFISSANPPGLRAKQASLLGYTMTEKENEKEINDKNGKNRFTRKWDEWSSMGGRLQLNVYSWTALLMSNRWVEGKMERINRHLRPLIGQAARLSISRVTGLQALHLG